MVVLNQLLNGIHHRELFHSCYIEETKCGANMSRKGNDVFAATPKINRCHTNDVFSYMFGVINQFAPFVFQVPHDHQKACNPPYVTAKIDVLPQTGHGNIHGIQYSRSRF